jgi:hypothetical protein
VGKIPPKDCYETPWTQLRNIGEYTSVHPDNLVGDQIVFPMVLRLLLHRIWYGFGHYRHRGFILPCEGWIGSKDNLPKRW